MSPYRIPSETTRVEIRAGNSRFITTVGLAASAKDAHAFIHRIRKEMPDATHHVYAFKAGYGASVTEGLSDDGEPAGTAGLPTMAVLRGADLGDTVLVTTRYFGGTKLGTGGLVAAYTAAAQAALAALPTEEKVTRVALEVTIPYRALEVMRRLLAEYDAVVEDERFEADILLRFRVAEQHVEALTGRVTELTGGRSVPRRCE
jgi:uncharacterized YigZ family protein